MNDAWIDRCLDLGQVVDAEVWSTVRPAEIIYPHLRLGFGVWQLYGMQTGGSGWGCGDYGKGDGSGGRGMFSGYGYGGGDYLGVCPLCELIESEEYYEYE